MRCFKLCLGRQMLELNVNTNGNGQPLALLPGFGFNHHCFDELVTDLSPHYQCIQVDFPGFGDSPSSRYSLEQLLTALQHYLPKRCTILGWSLGGSIALAYAAIYPDRVTNLVQLASNHQFIATDNWPGMSYKIFKEFETLCYEDFNKAFVQLAFLQIAKDNRQRKQFKKIMGLPSNHLLNSDAIFSALEMLKTVDFRKYYKRIKTPILQLFGEVDQLVPTSVTTECRQIAKDKPFRIEKVPQAGHMLWLEHTITHRIKEFLC